jgi:3-carboxy-cis,cis-muconate cycloisomerase
MSLYTEFFYSKEINQLFSDKNEVAKLLLVEAALAEAQAECGIIPENAAQVIVRYCNVDLINIENLKNDVQLGGNIAMPLVRQLTSIVKNKDPEAAKFVHLGATSQDIIDTATVLLIKEYSTWLKEKVRLLKKLLLNITSEYRDTVMIGRTLLQQATPITFGLKTAYWLESIARSEERILQSLDRLTVVQLSGATGSGNTTISRNVQLIFAKKLNLQPSASWHTSRDNMAEWAAVLGILTGSIGKIAKDISLLMQTEVGEVFEEKEEGKGGSSAMPHKRNPVTSAAIIANAARTPHLIATMMSTLQQEHERSIGLWHAEWEVLTQLMGLTAGAIEKSIGLIAGLEVDKERMLMNLEITKGLIYAENVTLALAEKMGKASAHELMEKACKKAISENKHLKEILTEMKVEIPDLSTLFNPENSIGNSKEIIDSILKKY